MTRFSSAVVIGFFFLSPIVVHNFAHAAVVINELFPKTDPVTREWIELYNAGSEPVSLDRWKIRTSGGEAILNASAIIAPHGFATFAQSQLAISFSIDGDTVQLFDANANRVDSQWYPGTLGYNTSMGRSIDGAGSWTLCTTATPNAANDCPQPSPTATPIPTSTPTPQQQTFAIFLPTPTAPQVLGTQDDVSPTPTPTPTPTPASADMVQFSVSKVWIAYVLLGVAESALLLMLFLWLRRRKIQQ